MLLKVVAIAGWAIAASVSALHAQTGSITGPAEIPPASFKGSQYVDSRGCVFLRAGVGGRTNWVARISRNRKPLCGLPPSSGGARVAEVPDVAPERVAAPEPAPRAVSPGPRATGRPLDTVASVTTAPTIRQRQARSSIPASQYAAPRTAAPQIAAPRAVPPAAPARPVPVEIVSRTPVQSNACPAHAPSAERVRYSDGRGAILCSPRAAVAVAEAPRPRVTQRVVTQAGVAPLSRTYAAPYGTVASLPQASAPRAVRVAEPVRRQARVQREAVRREAARREVVRRDTPPLYRGDGYALRDTSAGYGSAPLRGGTGYVLADPLVIPKGYKRAWKDGRLNPKRGVGTAQGQAAQDQVWTREVPARRIVRVVRTEPGQVVVSSSSAPRGRYYVQVGSFGVAANAQGARARLSGLGLPATAQRVTRGGRALQVVLAGPFGDAGQAQSALRAARSAGFGDAFIR